MTRKITAKDGADAIAMLDTERKARTPRTPRLHLDAKTGATVLDAKKAPAKKTALTDDKLSLRVVKVTKAQRVRDAFAAGMSLTEAAKATGADPAYVWDLAKIWEDKGNGRVPRSGHVKKAPTAADFDASTTHGIAENRADAASVATEKAEGAS